MKSEILLSTIKTEIGPFSFAVQDGLVVAATFGALSRLKATGRRVRSIPKVSTELKKYFAGNLRALDSIKVAESGSPFHRKVMRAMRKIRPGEVASYGDLARKAGKARASRAVGSACSGNPIPLIVPCHRVVRSDGALGQYGYGVKAKRWLLEFEGALEHRSK
ncbi:MAG: methylated-DNA--[protein]-cysteine S-methyltransferase [Actinobacteria bacterium]|nr:methylated-DNA--[protein]-cysteine S-methyltransferase [Actinomycetota bacterium]